MSDITLGLKRIFEALTGTITNGGAKTQLVDNNGDPFLAGVAGGEYNAILSDTVDLTHVGWIQPTLLAGTIKYTTEYGEVMTRDFDLKEVSLFRVKRVWSTGTTPAMGIVVIY